MTRREQASFLLALALAASAVMPAGAHAQGEPLSDDATAISRERAPRDFHASAAQEGLDGEAADFVLDLEIETAPILDLASTSCPVRIDVANTGNQPIYGAWFDVDQSFTRDGVPITSVSGLGTAGGTARIEIPVLPARTRLHARVECVDPPPMFAWENRYDSPISRSVGFSSFADVYGLSDEGISSMSTGQAAFSWDGLTYTPGTSMHPLLWHVIDLTPIGLDFDALLTRLFESTEGRAAVFQYLADSPHGARGQAIATMVAELPASQLLAVYSGLPVDVAGRALALLDERAFARTARVLRTTPEGRAAILSLLGVTDQAEQFDSVAGEIVDDTVDAALIALAAGFYLEDRRTTLFDQLLVRARSLSSERQSALAVALFTRWIEGGVPSLALEDRVLSTRDMDRPAVDALLRERAGTADTFFAVGALPTTLDALELYRIVTRDLVSCASSRPQLTACADVVDAHPELAAAAASGLRPELLASAQTMLSGDLDESTVALAQRYVPWGLDVAPIVETACVNAGPYSYHPEDAIALARALDPDAPCLREITAREEREADARITRILLGTFGVLVAIAIAYFFGRRGLRHLEKVRFDDDKARPQQEGGLIEKRIAPETFGAAFVHGLRGTESAVKDEDTPESRAVVAALTALRPHEAALSETARELVADVVATGKLRSELLELGEQTVYLVVVPGMHDQPQAFRRHEAFSHGWLAHVDRLKAMLGRSKLPPRLLSLFLFVRPDGTETAMLVALEDGTTRYLPFGLLDEEEVRAGAGRQGTHREQWSHVEGSV